MGLLIAPLMELKHISLFSLFFQLAGLLIAPLMELKRFSEINKASGGLQTFNRTAYGIETWNLYTGSVELKAFNRTAYGIETS